MNNLPLECEVAGRCSGCPWAMRNFATQLEEKWARVRQRFPNSKIVYSPRMRVRDRVDLVWANEGGEMRLGLYQLGEGREVLDLKACPMMSEPLEQWFQAFRQLVPPISKGSVRLRVSPSGERGVWLDFANRDVQSLFAQVDYLRDLSQLAFVEIGQRRKALLWREGRPRLTDPVLKPWFETYDQDFKAIPLYGPVGGFSQAGFAANRALVQAVMELAQISGISSWLELFSGNGNFALALAARGFAVEAVELDELALAGLSRSMRPHQPIKIQRADVYLQTGNLPVLSGRGLLVDPPRAGLRELLAQLERSPRLSGLIYVSCFTDVFLQDAQRLEELGYRLHTLYGVDQFPFSPHNEWVALFT